MFGIIVFGFCPIALGLLLMLGTAWKHSADRRRADAAAFAAQLEADRRKRQREAEKAAQAANAEAAQPKRPRGRPRKQPQAAPAAEQRAETIPAAAAPVEDPAPAAPVQAPRPAPLTPHGNNAFAGQVVAFTGTLPGMTRREAIAAVQANGGKAFDAMPAGTTLLVVGANPGMNKLDKADQWIGTCRKITPAQFAGMLAQPLFLELDEATALVRSLFPHNDTCEEA